jgi:hypothetical protein
MGERTIPSLYGAQQDGPKMLGEGTGTNPT